MMDASQLYCYYEEDPLESEGSSHTLEDAALHAEMLQHHVVGRAFAMLKEALESKGRKVTVRKVEQHASLIVFKDQDKEFEYDIDLGEDDGKILRSHIAYSYNHPATQLPVYAEDDITLDTESEDSVDVLVKDVIRKYR